MFSVHPTSKTYALSVLSILQNFRWQKLTVITEGAGFFEDVSLFVFYVPKMITIQFSKDNTVLSISY